MKYLLLCILLLPNSCKTTQTNLSTEESQTINPRQHASDLLDALNIISANKSAKIKIADQSTNGFSGPEDLQPSLAKINAIFKLLENEEFQIESYVKFLDELRKQMPKNLYPYALMRSIANDDDIEETIDSPLFCAAILQSFLTALPSSSVAEYFEPAVAKTYLDQFVNQNIQGVVYDGIAGRHKYTNQTLHFAVNYIANSTLIAPKVLAELVAALPKDQQEWVKRETNTEDANSRIEASDLLISELKHIIIGLVDKEPSFNLPYAGNLAQSIFQNTIIGDRKSSTPQYALLRNGVIDNNPVLICASSGTASLKVIEDYATEVVELSGDELLKMLPLEKLWAYARNFTGTNQKFEFNCGTKNFILSLKSIEAPKINRPVLNFNGDIHAISSVALVREMSRTMFTASLGYLVANGYLPIRISHTTQLKKDFMDLATDARIDRLILPVGHAFSETGTHLGSDKGTKVVAMKRVGKRTIYLHVFLPPFSLSVKSESINTDDMKAILCSTGHCEGLEGDANTVAVMTTSCHSAGTLDSWMTAYINSMGNPRNPKTPLVFASQEGFDTSNPFVIVSHLDHALRFTEGAAAGLSAEDLNNLMKKPLDYTFIRRIIEKAANLYQPNSKSKLQNNYRPACNIEQNQYFEGNFKLIDLEITPIQ